MNIRKIHKINCTKEKNKQKINRKITKDNHGHVKACPF